jgi:hypothetical protein
MDLALSIVKYAFVALLGVEVLLMVRAIVQTAREKANVTPTPATPVQE